MSEKKERETFAASKIIVVKEYIFELIKASFIRYKHKFSIRQHAYKSQNKLAMDTHTYYIEILEKKNSKE